MKALKHWGWVHWHSWSVRCYGAGGCSLIAVQRWIYAPEGKPPGTSDAQTRAVSPARRASASAKSRST